ncbi:MAG TPA: DUF3857 domain-containing protein [Terriglobales bacterium]
MSVRLLLTFAVFGALCAPITLAQQAPTPTKPASANAEAAQKIAPDASKQPASKAQDDASSAKLDLSKVDVVIETLEEKLDFEADGSRTLHQFQRTKVQSTAGVQEMGRIMVPFTPKDDVKFEFVRVKKPDGSVFNVKLDDMQEVPAPVTQQAPMYSDIRSKHLPIPNLRPGDTVESAFTTKSQPLVPGQFWFDYKFSREVIILNQTLQLSWPANKPVINRTSAGTSTHKTENGREVYTVRWENHKVPDNAKKKKKSSAATDDEEEPEDFKPDVEMSSFKSWKEVAEWADGLFSGRAQPTDEIKDKVAALTRDKKTDDEKIDAIYRYVAQEYRYIGISLGIGRWQPHSAETIFSNHYGDCKDKHTLLATMLNAAGFKTHPLLIPSVYKLREDVPSPAQFDHVITVVERDGGKLLIVDSTPELSPLGEIGETLRDKKALLIGGARSGELITTPAEAPFPLREDVVVDAEVNDLGKVKAKIKQTLRDDGEPVLRQAFNDVPRNKWDQLGQQLSYALGYAGDVENVDVSDPTKLDQPFSIQYDYSRADYITWEGRTGSLQLPLSVMLSTNNTTDENRKKPVKLGTPSEAHFTATVKVPQGAEVSAPPAVDVKYPFGEYHAHYNVRNGVLTAKRDLLLKQREVSVTQLPDYRAFAKAVEEDHDRTATVTRTGNVSAAAPKDVDADDLAEAAQNALQHRDLSGAARLAKQATDVDPKSKTAWGLLGAAEMAQFRFDDAVPHLRKQLEVDPDNERAPVMLALVLHAKGDSAAGIKVIDERLKAHSDDVSALETAGQIYSENKQWKEAAASYKKILDAQPENKAIQFRLAECYMALKDPKALELLKPLAEDSDGSKNNVAYKMSEHNYELPQALKWAEQDADRLARKVKSGKLEDDDGQLLRDSESEAAVWDTIGYIHLLMGNAKQAVSYLEAAWTIDPHQVVGGHLADAYAKAGDKAKEASVRKLTADMVPTPETMREMYEMRDRLKSQAFSHPAELQDMRTVHLKKRREKYDSAEFLVAIEGDGHAKEAYMSSGPDDMRNLAKDLLTASFETHTPTGLDARVVRKGIMSCGRETDCTFVMFPQRDAATPQRVTATAPLD